MSKSNLPEFIKLLRESSKRLKNNVSGAMYPEMVSLTEDLKGFSPVDKDDFRQGWRNGRISSPPKNALFAGRIENRATSYGHYLDQGVEKGAAPWYYPNPDKKRSGKLILRNGRVWAGGLSQSGFVVGGIIDKTIYYNNKRINRITIAVADAVIGAL